MGGNSKTHKKPLAALLLLLVTTLLFAQETSAPDSPSAAGSPPAPVTPAAPANPEAAIPLNLGRTQTGTGFAPDGTGAAPALGPTVSAWPVVRTFLAILLVTGALYLFYLWVKKQRLPAEDDNPYLRRLFSLPLGPGKSAQVITLGTDHAYLIGVADNAVSPIAEITDKELLSALTLYAEEHSTNAPKTFASLLALFTRRPQPGAPAPKTAAAAPGDTGFTQTETYLRSQLNRLRRGPTDA